MIKKKGNFTLKNITEDKVWESENIFHLKSDVGRYGKFLAHYEIYKKIRGEKNMKDPRTRNENDAM